MCLRPGIGGACPRDGDGGSVAPVLPGLRAGSGVVGREASRPGDGVLPGAPGVLLPDGDGGVGLVGAPVLPGSGVVGRAAPRPGERVGGETGLSGSTLFASGRPTVGADG